MKGSAAAEPQKLLREAAAWRLASLLLERPRAEWQQEMEQLSSEANDKELSSCVKKAIHATEEIYHRCFGPGGAVSPREVSYCGFADPGRLMAELNSFYRAFSYQPIREEPIDHISVETGFVGYLFLKEAYAEQRGSSEDADITKNARKRFIAEHVSHCASGIADRLKDSPLYFNKVFSWLIGKAQTASR
ncbi:MAG TPA: molecular chaperone TorD family protein [Candidatus Binatia bacterium]